MRDTSSYTHYVVATEQRPPFRRVAAQDRLSQLFRAFKKSEFEPVRDRFDRKDLEIRAATRQSVK